MDKITLVRIVHNAHSIGQIGETLSRIIEFQYQYPETREADLSTYLITLELSIREIINNIKYYCEINNKTTILKQERNNTMSKYTQFVGTKEDMEKIESLAVSWISKLDSEGEHYHSLSLIAYLIFHNTKDLNMAHIDIYTLLHYLTMSRFSKLRLLPEEYPNDERNLILLEE